MDQLAAAEDSARQLQADKASLQRVEQGLQDRLAALEEEATALRQDRLRLAEVTKVLEGERASSEALQKENTMLAEASEK